MNGCKTISCSVTGYRKSLEGGKREDACRVLRMKSATVASVADGHGDRRCIFADIGASAAVKVACDVLRDFERNRQGKPSGEYWNSRREQIARRITQGFALAVLNDYSARVPGKLSDAEYVELTKHVNSVYDTPSPAFPDEIRFRYARKKRLNEELDRILYLYGTTLRACIVSEDCVFSLAVGDGDSVAVTDEGAEWLLPPSDAFSCETASMCMGLDETPTEFLFSFAEIKQSNAPQSVSDTAYTISAVVLSTDGLRNSFLGDRAFFAKICEIEREVRERGSKSVSRKLRPTFERLSRNSAFQDDVTAVIIMV